MSHPDPKQEYWLVCDGRCKRLLPRSELTAVDDGFTVCGDCEELCARCYQEVADVESDNMMYCEECALDRQIMRADALYDSWKHGD